MSGDSVRCFSSDNICYIFPEFEPATPRELYTLYISYWQQVICSLYVLLQTRIGGLLCGVRIWSVTGVRILNSVRWPRGIRPAGARGSVPAGLAGRGGDARGGVIDLRTTCTATYRNPDAPIDFPVWGGSTSRPGRRREGSVGRDLVGGRGTELHLCGGIADTTAGSLGETKVSTWKKTFVEFDLSSHRAWRLKKHRNKRPEDV